MRAKEDATVSGRRYSTLSLWIGVAVIAIAIYFFYYAVVYMTPQNQDVVAGLLSAVIGFATLSAGTSLVRTYVISRAVEQK